MITTTLLILILFLLLFRYLVIVTTVTITVTTLPQIAIEATVGGWRGDIAIDEIEFTSGQCPAFDAINTVEKTTVPPTVRSSEGLW